MSGAPGAASTPTLPRSATPVSVMSGVALDRKRGGDLDAPLLPVARCLQSIMAAESRFFFLPFRPILEPADARALKAAISAQIWKVSLVFKEKMISDSDETMIRRCAFLGYPHSSDHSTHLGPSVYVLIHFHPSLHARHCKPKVEIALLFSLLRGGRHSSSVYFWSKHQGHQHRGFHQ